MGQNDLKAMLDVVERKSQEVTLVQYSSLSKSTRSTTTVYSCPRGISLTLATRGVAAISPVLNHLHQQRLVVHFLLGHQSLCHFAGEHLRSTHAILLSSELSVFPPPILVNPVCARWAQGDE